ncbi:ABC transporter ATP-binding protein [Bosea sp. 2KB_26]|uniref:ABC transporter ATP-binding protein n=1 Tax=Bosea sp. 2KB_26 TaxID=3237475 RepID=UPI003F9117FB
MSPCSAAAPPMLEIENLRTYFHNRDGVVRAVDDVSYSVRAGEMLGVVGESGCGKSITALSVIGLVPKPAGKIVGGHIRLLGRDLVSLDEAQMRQVRGNDIAMIFQEPMTALNPVLKVGYQIAETLVLHRRIGWKKAWERALEMLRLVQIPDPARRAEQYPHELSGGMRQRVMIAVALACDPKLLIADEPTTALDVTVQAQILALLRDLRDRLGTAVVLITHDLGVVAQTCDRVVVMYAGRKVEEADVRDLFRDPQHPYTRGLMGSMPRLASNGDGGRVRLNEIPGTVPHLKDPPPGCRFAARCPRAGSICRQQDPVLQRKGSHTVACFFPGARSEVTP